MSFKAFVWAWDQDVPNGDHHHVLLALANIAPAREVKASVPYIAKQVRRSPRKVRAAIDWLIEAGIITLTERPGKVDVIRLNIPANFQVYMPDEDDDLEAGVRGRPRKTPAPSDLENAKTPFKPLSNPCTRGADEPIEPMEPRSSLRSESSATHADLIVDPDLADDGYGNDDGIGAAGTDLMILPDQGPAPFDRWWAIYPLKIGKDAARKAWAARLAKGSKKGPLPPIDHLLERTYAFAEAIAAWPKAERDRFTPHAATWLNQARWDDDMNAVRSKHGTGTGVNGGLGQRGLSLQSLHEAALELGDDSYG